MNGFPEKGDKPGDEIESILSDLNAILSGVPPPESPPTSSPAEKVPETPPPAPAPAPATGAAPGGPIAPQAGPQGRVEPALPDRSRVPQPAASATEPVVGEVPPPPGVANAASPQEQVRRVAFFHPADLSEPFAQFLALLTEVSSRVSKKPISIEKVATFVFPGDLSAEAVSSRVGSLGAEALIGIFTDSTERESSELEAAVSERGILFRSFSAEAATRRSTVVDLVVDLLLLSPKGGQG
ncbi:MAG: hypothetical protein HY402_00310 [Elusimicrobia bacterium]|nr:hypothetical protein [Elusimicrobiota bacterium]